MEPTSLSQVKVDPLEIKTEDVKEENVDGVVGSLIQNEIKTEIKTEDVKEEYIETEAPDFQKPLRTEGDQIIPEPEEAALTTTCEHCERNFDDVSGLKRKIITGEKKHPKSSLRRNLFKTGWASLSHSGKSSR